MKVEIFSDIACPFCYIGMKNFESALADFEDRDSVEVTWRSFQLNPDLPREVEGDMNDYLAEKYGVSKDEARAMNDRVLASAHSVGLELDLDQARPANTFDAHRILHLAAESGREDEVVPALFDAYFNGRANLADPEDLTELAVGAGLDRTEVETVLGGDRFAQEVRADRELAGSFGITAVPTFVIDRKFGVQGAQPPEALINALTQATGD